MKKTKRICSMLMVFTLLMAIMPAITLPASAASASGNWTDYASSTAPALSGTTYTITSAAELAWVAKQVNNDGNLFEGYTIMLAKDIDLLSHYWEPIGLGINNINFLGYFDGNNKVISNMTQSNCSGLFGSIDGYAGAGIINTTLENVNISYDEDTSSGGVNIGGLVNICTSVSIDNCSVTGNMTANGAFVGGIAGDAEGCSIVNSNSAIAITAIAGSCYTGGIVGSCLSDTVINCYSSGKISGVDYCKIGGIAGIGGTIINCYSTSDITSVGTSCSIGGIASGGANVSNSYATGNLSGGLYSEIGGVEGENKYDASLEGGYWNSSADQTVNGSAVSKKKGIGYGTDGSTAKTSSEMKSADFVSLLNSYAATDSTLKLWTIVSGENDGYPVFSSSASSASSGSSSSGTASTETAADQTASPTASTVTVNGSAVSFDAYTIDGNNYFKLRDLAYVLSGTEKQFAVGWDGANNAISITSGMAYTAVGGEMTTGSASNTTATLSTATVYMDGAQVALTAYTINGNNYFKLRDVASALDFGVTWDSATSTIGIDTTTGYTA